MSRQSDYDRWATGGRYHSERVVVECLSCGNEFDAVEHNEYGASWLEPQECPECGEHDDEYLFLHDTGEEAEG